MTTERAGRSRPIWLTPRRWTVRWRLAAVSASLTLLILLGFAAVVGRLATDRVKDDFHDDMFAVANQVTLNIETNQQRPLEVRGPNPNDLVTAGDAAVRVVNEQGDPYLDPDGEPLETSGAPDLGAPRPDEVTEAGQFEVVSLQVENASIPAQPMFLQYGRSRSSLDATVERLWLLLGGGVLGGTMLALLAGLAVAGRAMRPIAALTQTAREIAATRDPSRRVPMPHSDDEIAELARTLDEMLRELDAARGESQQMVQAQREFVADASHELRTPLTSILANLELLQAKLALEDAEGEDAEIVDGALRSSRRMRRLVSDLLILARADAGRVSARRPCDLAEIVASALDEVRPVAGAHELELDAPGPVVVDGSPDELHRLVLNLVENGVRHTPPGTRVRVAVRADGGDAVLEVSDNGSGLPPGLDEGAFARFVRGGGPADLAADSGTGLGLAIVKAVAESHGGRVEASEAPGGGARFTVRLPVARQAQPTHESQPTAQVEQT